MKRIMAGITILIAAGSTACETAVIRQVSGAQLIDLDSRTRLVVQVEGVQTRSSEFEGVSVSKEGEPIHRVLQNADGKVLFAYDLQVRKSPNDGAYHFLLKPASQQPTFAAAREVTVKAHEDAVRVELMDQPATGRKVEDVFRLVDYDGKGSETHDISIGAHLRRAHAMLRQWIHGE